MKQPKTREEVAGELYREASQEVSTGAHNIRMLAMHISAMLRGIEKYPGPMWRARVIPPEGKLVVLDKFEDYLLRPQREGLHFKSLFQVHRFLEGADKYGDEALSLIRAEIPDWDERVNAERVKATARDAPAAVGPGQGRRTDKVEPSDNIRKLSAEGGTSSAYLAARIKRDAPEIAARVERGEFKSMRAAAKAAGIIKDKQPLDHLKHWWAKASLSERAVFVSFISSDAEAA